MVMDINDMFDDDTNFILEEDENEDTNPYSGLNKITRQGSGPEPKNNDGRDICWWCQAPTKKISSGTRAKEWDICTNKECGR